MHKDEALDLISRLYNKEREKALYVKEMEVGLLVMDDSNY